MSTVATISAVAGKKGIENVIGDIYKTGKGQLRIRFKRWKARKTIGVLYTKIKNIRKVKTILQPEKAVDLLKFYYPCKVKIDDKPKTIRDISEFHWDGNIVIKGTVGQGKSIFFRYLASREMVKGKKIPLFVELRRIGKGEKLVDHMVEEAIVLGLKGLDKGTFLWLAEKGKVVLLLDAFDEIHESERTRITNEIERLAKKYEHLQILISSRPNSGIENSPFFQVFEIAQLEDQEYEEAIRVMAEESVAGNIIKAVRSSRSPVLALLTTPLMVALLIVRHRIEQTVPENVIGFYQGLFGLLISRHDRMKGGYTRSRKSGLGDSALEDIFEGICFLTRKERQGAYVLRDFTRYAKESARLNGYKCEPDNVIEDIIKITCLILEEGEECKFIHKSVQEYHASCFIKGQPDDSVKRFYDHVLRIWSNWEQELDFLSMIDKYRFLRWFLITDMCQILDLEATYIPTKWKPEIAQMKKLFVRWRFEIEVKTGKLFSFSWGIRSGGSYTSQKKTAKGLFSNTPFSFDYASLIKAIQQKQTTLVKKIKKVRPSGFNKDCHQIIVKDLFNSGLMNKELKAWAGELLKEVHSDLLCAKKYVEDVEARKEVFEL